MNYNSLIESLVHLWTAMIISGVLTLVATIIGLWILAALWPLESHDDLAAGNME
jgi:hypothetical protein